MQPLITISPIAVSLGILIFSLAFTFIYVFASERLSDVSLLGKDLFTGRQIVWQSAFGLISESPLFGNGTDYLLDTVAGEKTASAHNTLLSIWYTLGVIPTATVAFFFVNRGREDASCKRDKITQISLLSSMIISFFESFYLDPTIGIFFLFFLLSNTKTKGEENK
jgi:O-antigen ligase